MFQSTHPRRVWQGLDDIIPTLANCFNPHTHAGCDTTQTDSLIFKKRFNPHTHAGCDVSVSSGAKKTTSFNPHTHAGCDRILDSNGVPRRPFQSTHPRRVWLCQNRGLNNLYEFQSTHPRRVWRNIGLVLVYHQEFQSTHPRRVWHLLLSVSYLFLHVSIHTPTQGVTFVRNAYIVKFKFQSTHPRRVWPLDKC